jgi:hypothetical protein
MERSTTMKTLAVIVLAIAIFSAAFVGVASAQSVSGTATANLTPFSAETNFMSQAGYTRYLNHQQTGQWTPLTP